MKHETVPVRCWNGVRRIDVELAPVIRAWNKIRWLVPTECCAGHETDPAVLSLLVRARDSSR